MSSEIRFEIGKIELGTGAELMYLANQISEVFHTGKTSTGGTSFISLSRRCAQYATRNPFMNDANHIE